MNFYDFVQQLGKGTFGTVNLCVKKHNQQKIVVKEIDISTHSDRLEPCKSEVAIQKSLNHPNIIRYYDSFLRNGTFHILMEYASKGTLHDFLFKSRPNLLEPQVVMNFFCQILMGLDHMHSRYIVHRDLKSENIFLTGLQGNVLKIGDFGISKVLNQKGSTNVFIGTVNYVSPEMCNGLPYDTKTDIWSLGCILYELCALERLFEGSAEQVLHQIKTGMIKLVDAYKYGQQMQDLINEMLNLEPAARPSTVKLMAHPDIFPTLYILGADLGCI